MFKDYDIISTYSRAQAIEDGFLVDLTPWAKTQGFTFPFAVTHAVWQAHIEWKESDSKKQTPQHIEGRLADLFFNLKIAIQANKGPMDTLLFEFLSIMRSGKASKPRLVKLKAICSPGDDLRPVITVMFPHED